MADRDLVRQSSVGKGSMVFGPTVYDVPLLPFERELIASIGITEEEYRKFVAEVKRRGAIRPAAYDHIPDVRCEPTTVLVNLAISLVLTGVSYLLTPKPKMPSAQRREGGVIDLGSVTGANRFTPSRGFETLAELADYASPIPLIFGLYKDDIGGMLTTPKLIWSRMFSHGTMQRAKLMFVVGEQGVKSAEIDGEVVTLEDAGIQPPELRGIFLGNNPLDAVFEDSFAFYWHADSSTKFRIRGSDKIYGTRGKAHRGDPDAGNDDGDAFVFPLSGYDAEGSEVFCHAYTPSNSAQFGTYGAIANGTNYRVNYQLVSIPKVDDEEAMAIRTLERIKIVGDSGVKVNGKTLREEGIDPSDATDKRLNQIRSSGNHAGAGRNYSPRMGIIEVRDTKTEDDKYREIIENVAVGDRAKFVISQSSIRTEFYRRGDGKGASVDDINSTVESLQIEADTAMQVGEHFETGGCIWKVVKRKISMFDPSLEEDQIIILECVDTSTSISKKVGVVNESRVVSPGGSGNEFIGDSEVGDTSAGVGEAFYPLTKVEIATIKNNRPAVSTEIGLKSTVFQRLNGLCNFQSLPSPSELNDLEEDGMQVNSGTISTSIMRSSMFRIFVRDVGSADDAFSPLSRIFVVRGQKPVPQYNYIKFTTEQAIELEYKFVPVSGSELKDIKDKKFIELSASISTSAEEEAEFGFFGFDEDVNNVGTLTVQGNGREVSDKSVFQLNKEFSRGYRPITRTIETSYPETFAFETATPEVNRGTIALIGSKLIQGDSVANAGIIKGQLSAFFYAIAGSADDSSAKLNEYRRFESVEYIGGNRANWLHLEWRLEKTTNALTYASSEATKWSFNHVTVLGSGGGFYDGQTIEVKRGSQATDVTSGQSNYPNSNPFVSGHPDGTLRFSGIKLTINGVDKDVKLPARSQAWRWAVFGDVDRADGETKRVTLTVDKDGKTLKADFEVEAYDFTDPERGGNPVVGRYKGWTTPKIKDVYKGEGETTTNWEVGDQFTIFRAVGSSNPFFTEYSRVGQTFKITEIITETTTSTTAEADLFFAEQSQYTDISAYRGAVEKSNNTQPEHEIVYVNEAQLNNSSANMFNLTIAGLSLKASRNFTALDQMRCWLGSGIPVERLHPTKDENGNYIAYGDSNKVGPSNLFTDLVYFLLTDQQAGAGGLLGINSSNNYLVDKDGFIETSKFLEQQKLFFNGPIVERTNLRQFISELAPYFLCNFIISDGKFSLKPVVPVRKNGKINKKAVQVDQLFTSGNILEDTYKLEYLGAEERRPFKAVVRYRQERKNKLPEEQVVIVRGADDSGDFSFPGTDLLPSEQFDLTQFCTSRDHAVKVAKYFLALRAYVTHTISFSTTVEGLNIQAGSYIRVITESSPYNPESTGTVNSSGSVVSVRSLPDDTYTVSYFKTGSDDVKEGKMTISDGVVEEDTFHDIVFTILGSTVSQNIYVVEQLTFSQEGTVDIVASEHPCDADGRSKIAAFVFGADGVNIQS
jgi:hypothetical protein